MHDVRHNGSFVARFETEEAASGFASLHGDEFSVESGRPFELHCEDGFIDSFLFDEDARAAMKTHSRFKSLSVKHDGEELTFEEEIAPPPPEPESDDTWAIKPSADALTPIEASEMPTDPAPPDATA